MNKVLTFGELLIRIQASSPELIKKDEVAAVEVFAGGSEANVAMALSYLNVPVAYCTAIPDNPITKSITTVLESSAVDVSKILWQGSRIGTYYLLSANGLTSGDVVYDRAFSAFSALQPQDFNWDALFLDCNWLHFTALTPALSANMASLMLAVVQEASARNMVISIDLNYRSKLWQYGSQPIDVMPQLVKYCHVIMGNIWAANKMLGTTIDDTLNRHTTKEAYFEYANKVARQIFSAFPNCRHVANTFRFIDNPKHNMFYGTYHTAGGNYISDVLQTNEVVDRIGSGDAFMAGLICGIYNEYIPQHIIDTATTTGFEKLFIKGDFINKM